MQLFSSKIQGKPKAEPFNLIPGSSEPEAPEPLFKKAVDVCENWRESAFFKAIESDRKTLNNRMGNKYNLNLENENIFEETAESLSLIKQGLRQNIKWEPIAKPVFDQVRWNSFDDKKVSKVMSASEVGVRVTSQDIRTNEQIVAVSSKQSLVCKKGNDLSNEIRITQTTRDTLFDSQIQNTDRNVEEPFNRFSGSLLSSSRGQDSIISTKFILDKKEPAEPPKLNKYSKKLILNQALPRKENSNLVQLQSVKLNYKNEVFGIQSAISEALKQTEKKPVKTPEKAVKAPKILRQSEEKKMPSSSASAKGYPSFLGNWKQVNHKQQTQQQDIRKSLEKLNLNNQDSGSGFLKVPKILPKSIKNRPSSKLMSPKIQQQKTLIESQTLTRKNTADKTLQSKSMFNSTVRSTKDLKPKIGMSERGSNRGSPHQ